MKVTEVITKSAAQISIMTEGGHRLSKLRDLLIKKIKPGIKTIDLENMAEEEITRLGGQPSFKTVRNYQFAVCVSINDEVVHGLPGERVIKAGDVVGLDIGMIYNGLHTDTAWTIIVPEPGSEPGKEITRFLKTGENVLNQAIKAVKAGERIGHISKTIQEGIEKAGYSVVKILTGHGVGIRLHEEPSIPQFLNGEITQTPEIKEGMTLAIEIIYCQGSGEVFIKDDGWTIATQDGKISATFEKSIAVVKGGVVVLTP